MTAVNGRQSTAKYGSQPAVYRLRYSQLQTSTGTVDGTRMTVPYIRLIRYTDDIPRNNKVKFVDFDWAGKSGVSRYPLLLSQQIQWSDGVRDGLTVMEKQHDIDMLTRLV
jgi:hypothetical protein